MRPLPTLIVVLFIFCGPLIADEPQSIDLTIHASAIETPALKYRLFPAEGDLKPGNAIPILLRLPWERGQWMAEVFPKLREWVSRPLDAEEWASSGGVLLEGSYSEMKRSAFRRDASWEYPIGETTSPHLILIPDVQELRTWLGYGLSARIRYHISRGELDEAREGILIGFANSRHIARTTFYINQLVARSIHLNMLNRVEELISQPKSPNLYWALSTLPDSLLELGRAASFEGDMFAMTFPAVRELDRPRDPREWSKMAQQLVAFLVEVNSLQRQSEVGANDFANTYVTKMAPKARAELTSLMEDGKERVAKMTDDEVVIRWYSNLRIAKDERMSAVMVLPPREAWTELKKLVAEIELMHAQTGTIKEEFQDPVAIYVSVWSLKRKIQSLRLIEAVRHHLASHDGKFPSSLDEIKDIPVPIDPLTNQPFGWSVQGNMATLTAPRLPADVVVHGSKLEKAHSLVYRLRVE